ncbi:hypothetical protein [Nocardia sp. NPDC006630]|uniref:hypothetical protein n=1 Tax=Nocardia sp. NPDC006630 TaxID=3157181 RepID=UPI0033A3DE57
MSQPGIYPPAYPGAAQPPQRVRPSGWWIAAGILVIVVGVAGAITVGATGFTRMTSNVNNFQRVPAQGWPSC